MWVGSTAGSMSRMATSYGQYCPLALAAEVLSERWTILVVSRLIDGCQRFNEIHRGVPKISATMLSQRLQELEDAGIVEREGTRSGRGGRYRLTEAGCELEPLVDAMAGWGQRWARDMNLEDLDVRFLAWSMHTRIDCDAMPPGRTVIEFGFSGTPDDRCFFWLVHNAGKVDMCLTPPGYEVDLTVRSDLARFVDAWRGFRSLEREIRKGKIRLEGPKELKRAFPRWLQLSGLAHIERQRPGRERATFRRSARPSRAS